MKILVTGSAGFVGRNLVEALKNLRDGKDRTRPQLVVEEIFEYDINGTRDELAEYCRRADFVFNLAGVNRPKDESEFMTGNSGFASDLLSELEACGSRCPVMLSGSVQASLVGRYASGGYGKSKLAGVTAAATMTGTLPPPARRCLSTVFRTFSENGADRTTTRW